MPILNVILGCSGAVSVQWWTRDVKELLKVAFHDSLTEAELAPEFDLRTFRMSFNTMIIIWHTHACIHSYTRDVKELLKVAFMTR